MNKLRFTIGTLICPYLVLQVDALLRWPFVGTFHPIEFNASSPTAVSGFVLISVASFFIFYVFLYMVIILLHKYALKSESLLSTSFACVITGQILALPIVIIGNQDYGSLLFTCSYYLVLLSISYFFVVEFRIKPHKMRYRFIAYDLSFLIIVLLLLLSGMNFKYFSDKRVIVLKDIKDECVFSNTPMDSCEKFHWGFRVPGLTGFDARLFYMWPGRAPCHTGDEAVVGRYGTLEEHLDFRQPPYALVTCKSYNKSQHSKNRQHPQPGV